MMTTNKYIIILIFIVDIFLFSCRPEEVILHGDLTGYVTDAETGEPIREAFISLTDTDDTTWTTTDGSYLLKNLVPGDYEMQVSKYTYATRIMDVTVKAAETKNVDFELIPIPVIHSSTEILDFGIDLTSKSLTISKTGTGKLAYMINPSKDWITADPMSGDIDNETDTITITINRQGLTKNIIKEWIRICSSFLQYNVQDTVGVYLNGVLDLRDLTYYKIVKIGTQTWMAENLNIGNFISNKERQTDNGSIEKYAFNNDISYFKNYGGLYEFNEAMQYDPPDTGLTGTTQGICPVGWHIPTCEEWGILIYYVGGPAAGGALKETGFLHWDEPNEGASNTSGFTALGGGWYWRPDNFGYINYHGVFWGSNPAELYLYSYVATVQLNGCDVPEPYFNEKAYNVRCIKNP